VEPKKGKKGQKKGKNGQLAILFEGRTNPGERKRDRGNDATKKRQIKKRPLGVKEIGERWGQGGGKNGCLDNVSKKGQP